MNVQLSTQTHREKHMHHSPCNEEIIVWLPGILQWTVGFAWTAESSESLPGKVGAANIYIYGLAN